MDVLDAPPRASQPLRVLLVEDDDGDAFLVTELLADLSEHIEVRRVDTLASAVSAPLRADCVLLDLQLPDAVGLTALTRLRQHAPSTAVVVLTGQRDEAVGVAAVAAGAQDYLVKGPRRPSGSCFSSRSGPTRTGGWSGVCGPRR